ncbi:hypothetical protein [Actinopolymorpha rutila]|uniref:Uncharacterized protein n=1 Tax=Actinopolymorpha rutila TaxID=446787 RepID=A0A852ZJR0_9ACTN|nr:hypothetical protein [Actinopolymorpha rutila]
MAGPLLVVGAGDRLATVLVKMLAPIADVQVDASTGGILSVLVFGAGTNYALLPGGPAVPRSAIAKRTGPEGHRPEGQRRRAGGNSSARYSTGFTRRKPREFGGAANSA